MRTLSLAVLGLASGTLLSACADRNVTGPANRLRFNLSNEPASATRTAFDGVINFCTSTPPQDVTVTGHVLHLRGATNRNQWVTGNALIDGVENNVVDGSINLKTGSGIAHLVVTLKPDAVNGTWEIEQILTISGGVPGSSHGVGHGTGDLHGMTIEFTTGPSAGQSTCNPNNAAGGVHGVITSPAVTG